MCWSKLNVIFKVPQPLLITVEKSGHLQLFILIAGHNRMYQVGTHCAVRSTQVPLLPTVDKTLPRHQHLHPGSTVYCRGVYM